MLVDTCRVSCRFRLLQRGVHRSTTAGQQNQSSTDETVTNDLRYVPSTREDVNESAVKELVSFLHKWKKAFVITGAGASTESGIRDYRSDGVGLYAVSTNRPMTHQEFVKSAESRHRYWARNYVGWPAFSSFKPNQSHHCLAKLEKLGFVQWLVTQNVDRLHAKAGTERFTELHGASARVNCLKCQTTICRHQLQSRLDAVNPHFAARVIEQTPDGDVALTPDEVKAFNMVDCSQCGGPLKPDVIFFGDNVRQETKDFLFDQLETSSGLLVVGSSLQVYSSYRFAVAAHKLGIPIAIVNIGPTRADHLAHLKIPGLASEILYKAMRQL